MHKGNADLKKQVLKNLADLNQKKENATERFLTLNNDSVVGNDSYRKLIQKLDTEIQNATETLNNLKNDLSNLNLYIGYAVKMARNLCEIWVNGSLGCKVRLQNLVFGQGLFYNKEADCYRTPSANKIFDKIVEICEIYELFDIKKGDPQVIYSHESPLVALRGLEPRFNG